MQSIRAWLDAHPMQARAVMDRNESYVFFKALPDGDPAMGPIGALGVALTAGRSAAVDRSFVPLGSPLFVASTIPDGRAWQHLVLAQDLGSAIQGQARVDVFLGMGPAAADWAGRMHQPGAIWVLLPRPSPARAPIGAPARAPAGAPARAPVGAPARAAVGAQAGAPAGTRASSQDTPDSGHAAWARG
jgi:membrane-bound lytic murein transglycosylase A